MLSLKSSSSAVSSNQVEDMKTTTHRSRLSRSYKPQSQ